MTSGPPIRKRLRRRLPRRKNQIANLRAPPVQLLDQALHRIRIVAVPLRRNLAALIAELPGAQALYTGDPFLKRLGPAHPLVDPMPRVQASQRRIRKIPLTGIEAEAVIDHLRRVGFLAALAVENRLPPVGVAGPFVEHEYATKIIQILDRSQLLGGKKIVNHGIRRLARIARAKLLSCGTQGAPAPELNHQVFGVRDQLVAHLHHFRLRRRQADAPRQPGSEQFVGQDAQALRIVLELDDVIATIRAAHQVRLRSTAHSLHLLDCEHHSGTYATPHARAPHRNSLHREYGYATCVTRQRTGFWAAVAPAGNCRARNQRTNADRKFSTQKRKTPPSLTAERRSSVSVPKRELTLSA